MSKILKYIIRYSIEIEGVFNLKKNKKKIILFHHYFHLRYFSGSYHLFTENNFYTTFQSKNRLISHCTTTGCTYCYFRNWDPKTFFS